MTKWEYKYILYDVDFINVELLLNELGSDGWDVSYMDFKGGAFRAVLKRPIFQYTVGMDFAKEYTDKTVKIWTSKGGLGSSTWCDGESCGCGKCSCDGQNE